jgi:hypothetical protein
LFKIDLCFLVFDKKFLCFIPSGFFTSESLVKMSAVLIRRGMQGRTGRKKEKNPTAVFERIGSKKNPNNINPN